mmetsp:Transcript_15116/g.10985  ORF Transcript_15116/g.10985 Transcript_15116/m.10985 type:complete len:91 (+) Transcript_15116:652-924(+)
MVRNSSAMIFLANAYCLMCTNAKKWTKKSFKEWKFKELRRLIKKLSFSTCQYILERGILANIGNHSKSFAMTQNQIGKCLRGFILAVTGN